METNEKEEPIKECCIACLTEKGYLLNDKETVTCYLEVIDDSLLTQTNQFPIRFCRYCSNVLQQFKDFKVICKNSMTTLLSRVKETELQVIGSYFTQDTIEHFTPLKLEEPFLMGPLMKGEISSNDELEDDIKQESPKKINKVTTIKEVLDKAMDRIYINRSEENLQGNSDKGWWDQYWQVNVKADQGQNQDCTESSDDGVVAQQKNVPIWCHFCDKIYPSIHSVKNNYTTHIITVHGKTCAVFGEIECGICGVRKGSRETFRHHFQNHRKFAIAKKCPQAGCSKTFLLAREYKAHKRLHNVKSGECPHCPYTSRSRAGVKSHIVMKHLGGKFCKYCRHAIPIEKWDEHEQKELAKRTNTPKVSFMCDICGKELISRSSRNSHMKHAHSTKPATCEVCGQVFTGAATLQKHFMYHHAEKRFECEICGYKSHHKSRLGKHMQHSHVADRFTTCDLCGKSVYKRGLEYHLKAIHERKAQVIANKEFKCDYCELAFSHKDSRNKHMVKEHGEERPFPCPACSNGYEILNELQKHMQKCHSGIESHQETIKNLEMANYNIVKNNNGNFDLSKVTDIGCVFGDFSCKICSKKFEILNTMRKHLDQHPETLPYSCNECKSGYFFEHQLGKHYKKMHKDVKFEGSNKFDPKKQKGLSIAAKVLEFTVVNGDLRTCSRQERLSRYNYQPKQKAGARSQKKQNIKQN